MNNIDGTWTVWCARKMRVETPSDMTMEQWELLRKYVEVMRPACDDHAAPTDADLAKEQR